MSEKRKINLTVKQINNADKTEQIIHRGAATIECFTDGFEIDYIEKDGHQVHFTFRNSTIELKRKAEVETSIQFKVMDLAYMSVESPFGMMEMKSYTHFLEYSENQLDIHYDVVNGSQVIASYQSEWTWEEER